MGLCLWYNLLSAQCRRALFERSERPILVDITNSKLPIFPNKYAIRIVNLSSDYLIENRQVVVVVADVNSNDVDVIHSCWEPSMPIVALFGEQTKFNPESTREQPHTIAPKLRIQ